MNNLQDCFYCDNFQGDLNNTSDKLICLKANRDCIPVGVADTCPHFWISDKNMERYN